MIRRTAIRILGAVFPLSARTPAFPGAHTATLQALAAAILPASSGDQELRRFLAWVHGYRAGAELEPGYGFPKLRRKPPSPVPTYLAQLASLETKNFAALSLEAKRSLLETEFNAAGIRALPLRPDGRHLAADLMAFYFRSSGAYDRCFDAAIRREECRGFEGFDQAPLPLRKGAK